MELLEELKETNSKLKSLKRLTTINVEKIPCFCAIGIHEEERKKGQTLLIDVHVEIDSQNAAITDNVNDTLSYIDIYKTVQKIGSSKPYSLIEVLAEDLVCALLDFPVVLKVKIKVHKPHIPYPDFKGNVSVEIKREN